MLTMKVNGEGHEFLERKRGLRQGDPMYHVLFIVLVMEYFSRCLKCISVLLISYL